MLFRSKKSAHGLAKPLGLANDELHQLQNLGVYLNYNGYGSEIQDLYFHPAELYKHVSKFASPFDFMQQDVDTYNTLEGGYIEDMHKAAQTTASFSKTKSAVYELPNAAWARRVSGVFGNDLANQYPNRAHAVVTQRGDGSLLVSVRAPINNKQGADIICRQFDTGGGRAAAAGINNLPADELARFVTVFSGYYNSLDD